MSNLGMYQYLTTTAKAVGGPELFMDMLVKKGVKIGIKTQRPIIIGATLAGVVVGGLISYYATDFGTLKANRLAEQDEELNELKADFREILNEFSDERSAAREEEPAFPEVDELQNLTDRLDRLIADARAYDEKVFGFIKELGVGDDDYLKSFVMRYPGYKEHEAKYREMMPDADDLDIVNSFINVMAPVPEEEVKDEFQS